MGRLIQGDSVAAKALVQLMISVPSCLMEEAGVTDSTKALDLAKIYDLIGSASRSGWRRQWQPTPILLPGKSHGQRSLVGCSPWGREESDTTEQLHFHFHAFGERNGNPLQCCCLENPRDGAAWWAAVYGVAQSRT